MSYLQDVGLFALLFVALVFFHELGHFLMAKWVGIRVERFSVGMGPAIFSKKWGETEYRLAAIPLGGYVKMSGDDPTKEYSEEEKKRGFLTQSPPAKLLVVFGGPVFNLVLPIFVFSLMLAIGWPTVRPVIGTLDPEHAAAVAGLRSGDVVQAVNGQELRQWREFEQIIRESAEKNLVLSVERQDLVEGRAKTFELPLRPRLSEGMSRFGEPVEVGMIGVSPAYTMPMIYFEDPQSPLAVAGFEPFDVVHSINSQEILTLSQWDEFLDASAVREFELVAKRGRAEVRSVISVPGEASLRDLLRVEPVELVVGEVSSGGAAAGIGMQVGDRLISIGGTELLAWENVFDRIQASAGEPIEIVWSRGGEILRAEVSAERTTHRDPMLGRDHPLGDQEAFRIGVAPRLERTTSFYEEQTWNPVVWLSRGVSETWELTTMTATALWKLVTGQISLRLLGSPIMIYKVTGTSFRMAGGGHQGWIAFLTTLALLSVSLGLINLLPIPILDGGHAVFFTIEWIRGKRVSLRTMEIASQVGLFVIVGLFAMVFYNDLSRYDFFERVLRIFQ